MSQQDQHHGGHGYGQPLDAKNDPERPDHFLTLDSVGIGGELGELRGRYEQPDPGYNEEHGTCGKYDQYDTVILAQQAGLGDTRPHHGEKSHQEQPSGDAADYDPGYDLRFCIHEFD